jgi:hypothetical protein
MRKIIPLFLLFSFMYAGAAQAAPAIDAAGASVLKKQVNDELQWNADMSAIEGQGLKAEGKAEVTPKKDFYEVKLPHLYMDIGQQEKKTRIDLGSITLNVVPGAEDGIWKIQQLTLPPSMTVYDDQNAQEATITIGEQHFTAEWAPGHGFYPKHDALFQDVEINGSDNNPLTGNITKIKSLANFKDNGDGTWSGSSDADIEGITLSLPGSSSTINVARLSSHKVYEGLDTRAQIKTKVEVLKHGLPQTDSDKKALLVKFDELQSADVQGSSNTSDVSGFSLQKGGEEMISFDQLTLAHILPNAKQEKRRILVKTAFQGLNIPSIPQPFAALIPHTLNAEITIDNLPEDQLSDAFFALVSKARTAKQTDSDPVVQKHAREQVLKEAAQFPKIFGNAGTSVSVQNTYAASDDVSVTLQSQLKASPEDALGFSGSTTIGIKGLDEFVQKSVGGNSDPHTLSYLTAINSVDAKGTPAKAADGTSLRNYAIELKKSGEVTVNGVAVNGAKQ